MNQSVVLHLIGQAMAITAEVVAPILIVSMAVGLLVSIFQSVTQIQEFTLSFVPKVAGVGLVLLVAGHWALGQLVGYTQGLFAQIPRLLSG